MNSKRSSGRQQMVALLAVGWLAWVGPAQAQPSIVSTVPANGATGVAPMTTVVFNFSAAMNPASTSVSFFDLNSNLYSLAPAWSAGNTVLTCTPAEPFPANTTISWFINGNVAGNPTGTFTTSLGDGLLLNNAVWAPDNFSFDVHSPAGQMVTVEYRTQLATGPWQTLLTTNSPGPSFRAVAPQAATNSALFFRARSGT